MKIIIKHYDITRTVKTKNEDINFIDFMDLFKDLCKSMYAKETIDDYWE